MTNYGDLIEYVDGTLDNEFLKVKKWCKANNATLDEEVEKRVKKDGVLYRYYRVNQISEPTIEQPDIATLRERAYIAEVDNITCNINRLRDEEQTEEVKAKIEALLTKRQAKVEEIKARYPYPEAEVITPNDSENNELEEKNAAEVITPSDESDQVSEQVTDQVSEQVSD